MSKNIYLIGTSHDDPDGAERLEHIFNNTKPTVITAEASQDRVDFILNYNMPRDKMGKVADKQIVMLGLDLDKEQREKYLELMYLSIRSNGFELRTSKQYCDSHDSCMLKLIDLPIMEGNLEKLVDGILDISLNDLASIDKKTAMKVLNYDLETHESIIRRSLDHKYKETEMLFTIYFMLKNIPEHEQKFKDFEIVKTPDNLSGNVRKVFEAVYNPGRNDEMANNIMEIYEEIPSGNIVVPVGMFHVIPIARRLKDLEPKLYTLRTYNKV